MTTSHSCCSISFLIHGAVWAVGEGVCCVVWSDGGPFHESVEEVPIAEEFELGRRSKFAVFAQEGVADHPDPQARQNTASLRRPTNPLSGFDGRRLPRGTCSPPSIPLAPMAFDAAFPCFAALQSPSLRVAKFGCKPIPGGRL